MANLNQINGKGGSAPCKESYAISNITSDVAVSVRGIMSFNVDLYGRNKTLKDIIRENTSSEYKTTLLLKISHCLLRLEKNQTPIDELSPSGIFIREKELANESISNIGKTFFHILTGNKLKKGIKPVLSKDDCDDHFTAQDLIEQMIDDKDFTIKDVLLHPLFWSKQEKIIFICNIYDRIVPKCKIENKHKLRPKTKEVVEEYGIDVEKNDIIPDGGWIKELVVPWTEISEMEEKNSKLRTIRPDIIRRCAIKIEANPSCAIKIDIVQSDKNSSCPIEIENVDDKNAKFDKNSIFELMRFFRIHHAHYWEKNEKIRIAFGDYNDGYWNFYQHRFPKLLIHVYRAVKGRFDNDNLSKNSAPFKYLES